MTGRLVLILVAALLGSGAVSASDPQPAELPPQDFTARQYIDSKGCVFLRGDGGKWASRLARDGAPICGYPPTFSARRVSPDEKIALFPSNKPEPDKAQQLEAALTEIVITNLRPGELVGDDRPRIRLPDAGPEPHSTGPVEDLKAQIAAAPRIRAEMGGGLRPNEDLCRLLGYNGKGAAGGTGKPALGQDPSQGFCDALPRNELARLAFARPVPQTNRGGAGPDAALAAAEDRVQSGETHRMVTASGPKARPERRAGQAMQPAKVAKAGPAAKKQGAPAKSAARTPTKAKPAQRGGGKQAAVPPESKGPITPLLAAGARYVQVGVYSDAGNAERAIAKMTQLGLPVLRNYAEGRGPKLHVIVSGPFDSRQTLVIALDRIRQAGFRDAYPR